MNTDFLADSELHLIYKPQTTFQTLNPDGWKMFVNISKNSRCTKFVKSWITNEELIKEFYTSHCIILPYLWGTHSGQIELAKDCGCYVVAPDVGFYAEQWDKTILWGLHCKNKSYIEALKEAYSSQPLSPMGEVREHELKTIIEQHLTIYQNILGGLNNCT